MEIHVLENTKCNFNNNETKCTFIILVTELLGKLFPCLGGLAEKGVMASALGAI